MENVGYKIEKGIIGLLLVAIAIFTTVNWTTLKEVFSGHEVYTQTQLEDATTTAYNNGVNSTADELADLNEQVTSLQSTLTTKQDELNLKLYQLQNAQASLEIANADKATLQADKIALQAQIDEINAEIANLQSQLNTANASLTTLQDAKATLQSEYDTKLAELAALNTQLNSANADKASLQTQINTKLAELTSLQTQLDGLNAQINPLNAQIADLQGQLSTANASITGLQSQLTAKQNELDTANASIANLNSQIEPLNAQIATLQSDISTANNTITTLNATIASLNAQIAELTANVNIPVYMRDAHTGEVTYLTALPFVKNTLFNATENAVSVEQLYPMSALFSSYLTSPGMDNIQDIYLDWNLTKNLMNTYSATNVNSIPAIYVGYLKTTAVFSNLIPIDNFTITNSNGNTYSDFFTTANITGPITISNLATELSYSYLDFDTMQDVTVTLTNIKWYSDVGHTQEVVEGTVVYGVTIQLYCTYSQVA